MRNPEYSYKAVNMDESSRSLPRRPQFNQFRRFIAYFSLIYAIFILSTWLFLRFAGDRSWLGTIAIFSPRWLVLLPAIPLIPAAFIFNRRCLWIIAITIVWATFSILGLCIPWRTTLSPKTSAPTLRVLTCNIHLQAVHPRRLADLIATAKPDIVLLQEWTPPYDPPVFNEANWNIVTTGEMCLATRFPIETSGEVPNAAAVHYLVKTSVGKFDLYNVHFASPHHPLYDALHGLPSGVDDLDTNIEKREEESQLMDGIAKSIS